MSDPVVILLTLLACAFFSGIEIAFISANKLRLELLTKQGNFSAKLLSPFVKAPSKFISTTLVGNSVSLVIYTIYFENRILDEWIQLQLPALYHSEILKVLVESFVSTIFILFTAEFLPKVLFRINPDLVLQLLAVPFLFFYYLFYPLVHFIMWLAKRLLNDILKMEWNEGKPVFNKLDLDQYVSESAPVDIADDAEVDTEMFLNALDFGNVKVRDCMIPRTEIVAVEVKDPMDVLFQSFTESGHSKVLVYEESVDLIIGYVHQTSMFSRPKDIRSCLIPIVVATESMPARELLDKFTSSRKSMATVVDEFGGTAGIVTIEDILEEIFGEIKDEFDEEQLTEKEEGDDIFIFSARLEIDHLNQRYDLKLPDGEYETLGGYIYSVHESVPEQSQKIHAGKYEFEILSMDGTRIDEIRVQPWAGEQD